MKLSTKAIESIAFKKWEKEFYEEFIPIEGGYIGVNALGKYKYAKNAQTALRAFIAAKLSELIKELEKVPCCGHGCCCNIDKMGQQLKRRKLVNLES